MEKNNNEKIDLIKQYLDGQLEGEKLVDFESKMTSDKDFKKEVEIMRSMVDGIEMLGEENLRSKISKVKEKLERENFYPDDSTSTKSIITMQPKKRVSWLAIAAALAALVIALTWYNSQNIPPTPEEAYAKFYKNETEAVTKILDDLDGLGMADPDANKKDLLATALDLYANYKYEVAIDSLNNYLVYFGEDSIAKFYLGLSYMNLSDYGKAVETLSPLITLKDFSLLEDAKWYLALSYSMLNTTEGNLNAVTLMNQLKDNSALKYKTQATAYLDFVKKN